MVVASPPNYSCASESAHVTQLLDAWSDGDQDAFEDIVSLVYVELRRMAQRSLWRERPDHTLQPTALVHEAYLRLCSQGRMEWRNRNQFLGVAAELMRRVLVDHARRRQTMKRDGGVRVNMVMDLASSPDGAADLLLLDEALRRLEARDPRQARIVELRYFSGLKVAETATVLDLSPRTVKREWTLARAWLKRELSEGCRGAN